MLKIIISNSSGIPIYEQITIQLKELIISGELKEGELLPSIRQLAKDLRISVITTSRAYSELEQDGFISTMQGKGCFVLPRNTEMMKEQYLRHVEEDIIQAIADARLGGINEDELKKIFMTLLKEEHNDE